MRAHTRTCVPFVSKGKLTRVNFSNRCTKRFSFSGGEGGGARKDNFELDETCQPEDRFKIKLYLLEISSITENENKKKFFDVWLTRAKQQWSY